MPTRDQTSATAQYEVSMGGRGGAVPLPVLLMPDPGYRSSKLVLYRTESGAQSCN